MTKVRPPTSAIRFTIKEVGPRDGLQNESHPITVEQKCQLIQAIADAGVRYIECGAFVSPQRVPQMANSDTVFAQLTPHPDITYAALVPNEKGFERAIKAGAQEIAVFIAASETFSQKNTQCSIAESLARAATVIQRAQAMPIRVRAYLSCVLGCPYEGSVSPQRVAELSAELMTMGCYEISLGDTLGIGAPPQAIGMYEAVLKRVPAQHTALHFHDTYGRALANLWSCIERGARVIDCAIGGLGGCPYAPGAGGNVATENVVDCLHAAGFQTGIDLPRLLKASQLTTHWFQRPCRSAVSLAYEPP